MQSVAAPAGTHRLKPGLPDGISGVFAQRASAGTPG